MLRHVQFSVQALVKPNQSCPAGDTFLQMHLCRCMQIVLRLC